jgi:hypothetical protein
VLAKRFGLRALEIGYVRTSLPNSAGNIQNDCVSPLAFFITWESEVNDRRTGTLRG